MRHDAIVVGGSFAGLSAALYIARGRRTVCVIDSGSPRNRFAAASHGVFAQDGQNPQEMIARAKRQLGQYPSVSFIQQTAVAAESTPHGFRVRLANGETQEATKLVLAFGVSDVLPDIPGLADCWGVSVLHCPYCHGFEFSDRQLGILYAGPSAYRHATLISEWGPTTLYLNGATDTDAASLAELRANGIHIEPARLLGADSNAAQLSQLHLGNGRMAAIDALYLHPQTRLNSSLAEQLGCVIEPGPFGPLIQTDAGKQTSVIGVYAAGDIARAPHSATWAAADGITAGTSLHQALVFHGMT